MHEDRDLFRLIVETVDEYAIFVLDGSRKIQTWNRGAERLLGYTPEEIVGRSADLIFTPEDIAAGAPEQEAATALEKGKAEDNRWHVRKDGSRFWGSGMMFRLDDGPRGVRGLAKILRDQTSLKLAEDERDEAEAALRASELRFRRLIEANIVGVGIASSSGEWIDANEALLKTLGHTEEDLRAGLVRWDRMTPEEYRAVDEGGIAQADRDGACVPYEKEYVRPDGRRVPVLIGYATVSGIRGYYVCFVLDLGPQKRVERALRDADRRKDEFLAMLAHELRNPLSAIGNAVHVIRRSTAEQHLDWAKEVIDKQVRSLARMIDDLLDVSRITRGKIQLRRQVVELFPIVAQAAETIRPVMEQRKHEFVIDHHPAPTWVDADPQRLEQVLVNLLSNAARYTDPGGKIVLSTAPEGDAVVITVTDNGAGIPPERIPEMFELFAQGDRSVARSEGGLGIGLTLAKNLVEMHGGSLAARSEGSGRGSEFTVRSRPSPPPSGAGHVVERGGVGPRHGLRVLVVDDNRDTARGLVRLLTIVGLDVETAFDGPSALEAARRQDPEVILLDIGLPGMDGYDVARRLRAGGFTETLIIAISGYGEDSARQRSREAGFDHHLVKPLDYEELVSLMRRET
ncbi:MAG: PAS domain S-box protein [Isosphaeraceae bacterium]